MEEDLRLVVTPMFSRRRIQAVLGTLACIVALPATGCGDDALGSASETTGASTTTDITTTDASTTDDATTTDATTTGGSDSDTATTGTSTTSTSGETTDVTTTDATTTDATTTDATTDATTTDATTDATTGDEAICGDGGLDPGEECDDGDANDDSAACTSECTIAFCGDGLVHLGVEECDGEGDYINASCSDDCLLTCDLGFDDCNDDLGDGCEVSLDDPNNCGACDKICLGGTLCTADGCCGTVTVQAAQSVSLTSSQKWNDNRVRAYTSGGQDIIGWSGYDLSALADDAQLVAARAYLHHEVGFSNPLNSPTTAMVYSPANDWTRAAVQPGQIAAGATISAPTNSFDLNTYNEFVLDIEAWDWSQDLADDWLTIGIDELGVDYRYVYFYGTDSPQTRPYIELDLCE